MEKAGNNHLESRRLGARRHQAWTLRPRTGRQAYRVIRVIIRMNIHIRVIRVIIRMNIHIRVIRVIIRINIHIRAIRVIRVIRAIRLAPQVLED